MSRAGKDGQQLDNARVSELANLTVDDIDFMKPAITVRGKGRVERQIELEKKGIHALKSYLAVRPDNFSKKVFLNYLGEPISERGCDPFPRNGRDARDEGSRLLRSLITWVL